MPIRRLLGRLRSGRRRAPTDPVAGSADPGGEAAAAASAEATGGAEEAPDAAAGRPATDRRREVRIRHFGWARYALGDETGEGLVTDLSVGGAFVERPTLRPSPGAKLELRLKPAGGHPTLPIDCEVVRVEERGLALRFATLPPEAEERLAALVAAGIASAAGCSGTGPG